ncbi:MAG: hypothetical protein ACRDWD_04485 [Acidimicrobiia bacterium]
MHELHEHFHRRLDEHHPRRARGVYYRRGRRGRRYGREDASIDELEEYQRDLEQRVADVAERIRQLRTEHEDG